MTTPNEDVQRLLASLASYSNQGSLYDPSPAATNSNPYGQQHFNSSLPGLAGVPADTVKPTPTPTPAPYESSLTPRSSTSTPDPRLKRPFSRLEADNPPGPSRQPTPDASLITSWSTAISHVMTHLLPDPAFATKIRRLITSQHAHERDWHDKRLTIAAKHAARSTSSAQLQNIFANLGVPQPHALPTGGAAAKADSVALERQRAEVERRELQAYDAKVYKQLLALAGDFDRQLRGIGVPFYAIRHELVVMEEGREQEGGDTELGGKRIDRGELRELQKRMLGWLEMSFPVD